MIKKFTVFMLILSSVLVADDFKYNDISLIGVEGGVSIDNFTDSSSYDSKNLVSDLGLKVGAKSDYYRVLLGANYYIKPNKDYKYIATYGAELDYLIGLSDSVELYLGANAGMARIELSESNSSEKKLYRELYYGPDAGININLSELVDLEFGSRFTMINESKSNKYSFNNIVTIYSALIFKFKLQ